MKNKTGSTASIESAENVSGFQSLNSRFINLLLALLFLAAAILSMRDYPLGLYLPAACAVGYVLLLMRAPGAWLITVPALLPVLDQTALTGRILVTESDCLLLLTLCVGYAKKTLVHTLPRAHSKGVSRPLILVSALLCGSYLISTCINLPLGFDAGLQGDQHLAGYHDQWNVLRVAKGFFFPLLFVPLLRRELQLDPEATPKRFGYGIVLGLAAVSVFAVYERLAFVSFTDFATDYRITASFWEMNVGGAALDGFLLLALPFAAWLSLRSSVISKTLGMLLLMVATYVVLVTFTRTTYAAAGVIAAIIILGHHNQKRQKVLGQIPTLQKLLYLIGAAGLIFAMHHVFQTGGYRTLAALIIVVLFAHYVFSRTSFAILKTSSDRIVPVCIFVFLILLNVLLDKILHKGSYLMFAAIAALLLLTAWRHENNKKSAGLLIGLWFGLLMSAVVIAWHWGGRAALISYVPVAFVLGLVAFALLYKQSPVRTPVWNWNLSAASGLLMFCALTGLAVTIVGNYQMSERFSESNRNLEERISHWNTGIGLLKSPRDWLLGRGVGSFPASYLHDAPDRLLPGTFAFKNENSEPFLAMTSRHTDMGPAEMLRLMQRVAPTEIGHPVVMITARTVQAIKLSFEVCGRHLIYPDDCVYNDLVLEANNGQWQNQSIALKYGDLHSGPWYAPKTYYFAFGIGSTAKSADIANVQLIGNNGKNLLENYDFQSGTDHWFFTSDRNHLPWHIKNLFLNILFDQGLFGLACFLLFVIAVLARSYKHRRSWPEAPYYIAGISGFLVAGLFDSLLDVPRVAVLFYLMCWMMLLRPVLAVAPRSSFPSNTAN